jgi:hypothetical protein
MTRPHDTHGASPLPKGDRKKGVPMFEQESMETPHERDKTGQTDTSVKHMKQRLAEVPKKSSGSRHDQAAFDRSKKKSTKSTNPK